MKHFRYLEQQVQLQLDEHLCIGCGNCLMVCPHRVFAANRNKVKIVDHGGCMECGACSMNCPVNAIQVNPEEGCGCAAFILKRWLTRITGKTPASGCTC